MYMVALGPLDACFDPSHTTLLLARLTRDGAHTETTGTALPDPTVESLGLSLLEGLWLGREHRSVKGASSLKY